MEWKECKGKVHVSFLMTKELHMYTSSQSRGLEAIEIEKFPAAVQT